MAKKEKELHSQLYPGWSARDNYATHTKKKKRKKEPEFMASDSRIGGAERFPDNPAFGNVPAFCGMHGNVVMCLCCVCVLYLLSECLVIHFSLTFYYSGCSDLKAYFIQPWTPTITTKKNITYLFLSVSLVCLSHLKVRVCLRGQRMFLGTQVFQNVILTRAFLPYSVLFIITCLVMIYCAILINSWMLEGLHAYKSESMLKIHTSSFLPYLELTDQWVRKSTLTPLCFCTRSQLLNE